MHAAYGQLAGLGYSKAFLKTNTNINNNKKFEGSLKVVGVTLLRRADNIIAS